MASAWPRLMKLANAAAYVDMTAPAFLREVESGRLPAGRLVGGKEHWDKLALDRAVDAIMGGGEPDWRKDLRRRYGKAAA